MVVLRCVSGLVDLIDLVLVVVRFLMRCVMVCVVFDFVELMSLIGLCLI